MNAQLSTPSFASQLKVANRPQRGNRLQNTENIKTGMMYLAELTQCDSFGSFVSDTKDPQLQFKFKFDQARPVKKRYASASVGMHL